MNFEHSSCRILRCLNTNSTFSFWKDSCCGFFLLRLFISREVSFILNLSSYDSSEKVLSQRQQPISLSDPWQLQRLQTKVKLHFQLPFFKQLLLSIKGILFHLWPKFSLLKKITPNKKTVLCQKTCFCSWKKGGKLTIHTIANSVFFRKGYVCRNLSNLF